MALSSSTVDVYFPDVYDHPFENRVLICRRYCKRITVGLIVPVICVMLGTAPWVAMPFMLNDISDFINNQDYLYLVMGCWGMMIIVFVFWVYSWPYQWSMSVYGKKYFKGCCGECCLHIFILFGILGSLILPIGGMYCYYRFILEYDDPLDYLLDLYTFVFDFREPLFWAIVLFGNMIFIICLLSLCMGICCCCKKTNIMQQDIKDGSNNVEYDENGDKIAAVSPGSRNNGMRFDYGYDDNNNNNVEMASIDMEIQRELHINNVNKPHSPHSPHSDGPYGYGVNQQAPPPPNGAYQYNNNNNNNRGSAPYAPGESEFAASLGPGSAGPGFSDGPGEMIQPMASYDNRDVGFNPHFAGGPPPPSSNGPPGMHLGVPNNNHSPRHMINDQSNSNMYDINFNNNNAPRMHPTFSQFEGYYKHCYLIIVNLFLVLSTAVYIWFITPQTSLQSDIGVSYTTTDDGNFVFTYDTSDSINDFLVNLTSYEKFVVSAIAFKIIKKICKFFGKRIDRNKDATSASIQVFIEIFFAALYYYTLRILLMDFNESYLAVFEGVGTNMVLELWGGCIRGSEWYFNLTSKLFGHKCCSPFVDTRASLRQWQKMIAVNIVFNFMISLSSLILLILRFGLMVPGVLWLTSEINDYTGSLITDIKVHYRIFPVLAIFIIFDVIIFLIQIKCFNFNALVIMTTDHIKNKYGKVIKLLIVLWGAQFFIFGATDWYLIQLY